MFFEELVGVIWDIGPNEVQRFEEWSHFFATNEKKTRKEGGEDFLVNRELAGIIENFYNISEQVAGLIINFNNRYE